MVAFPGAGGASNAVAVRTIAQSGSNVWVGGKFSEIDDANGSKIRDADNMAVFDSVSGAIASGVHIPSVTSSSGDAEVYDTSVGPDGKLYFAGHFDAVDGQTRHNAAAIDATTGALTSFAPNAASAYAVLATASAVYVGTGKLLSYQLNGQATPGYTAPTAIVDASIRAHETPPQFRDIQLQGDTLVATCQCDSLTDAVGTRTVKAVVEITAANGRWVNWRPANLPDSSAAFGITEVIHAHPSTGNPTVYLAAGGSDFTAAYDFNTGQQRFKTDTSGSSQAIVWYQGFLVVGGHYDWTESPGANGSCGDNASPNTTCYHTPKLSAMNATDGTVLLNPNGTPWNPGICCKYNGVWALLTGNDGSSLHVGGEFTKVGGTWSGSGTNWTLTGASKQQFYARLGGPAPSTQSLTVQKSASAGATGTVTSSPSGINCNVACSGDSADFPTGLNVVLTATPTAGSTFTGWSSGDAGFSCPGTGSCTVNMNIARTVVATFAGISFPLSVSTTGAGTGIVTSTPAGIDCGTTCSSFFTQNTLVTLAAAAGVNSAFNGWSGSGCSGTGACVVTMSAARSVTADFASTLQRLTVGKASATQGRGTITSSPSGINCGNTCTSQSVPFSSGTVTLSQSPAGSDAFAGWTSSDPGFDCPGLGNCTVTMDMSRNVVAHFEDAKNVKLSSTGTGGGTVTSDPAIMSCTAPIPSGTTCDQLFALNSDVTLLATPDANSVFTGWSSSGSGSTAVSCPGTGPCTFNMGTTQKQVTAAFAAAYALTVRPDAGSGDGTVTSSPAGIDCGLTCATNFAAGSVVTLTATPDENSTFTGWSGEGCGGSGTCVVTMSQARDVTATFTLVDRTLVVHAFGHGNVADNPGPIDCTGPAPETGTCSGTYEHGTDVELTATPDLNWSFSGWGGDCTGTEECVVSMTQARDVTATFERIIRTVAVSMGGSGTGTVTSSPGGIDCPGDCSEGFGQGNGVDLTPTAGPGSTFTGWGGDCGGAGVCHLTVDGEKNAVATFELLHELTVTVDGTGSGSVSSDVGGIDCPAVSCSAAGLANGAHVLLTASPDGGSAFAGWSGGGCSGTAPTCDVRMAADQVVTATFGAAQSLSVSIDGAGSGMVTGSPGAISCPTSCAHDYAQNAVVVLHAAPAAGSAFTGWSSPDAGFDCPDTADCTVTMDIARAVTATFEPAWTLTVQRSGTGSGTVTSDVGAIDCPGTCDDTYLDGTVVTLHAAAGPNATFIGWAGDTAGACLDTSDCAVTMDQTRAVTATFDPIVHGLTVTRSGAGTGTVTSLTPNLGIDCGATCRYDFVQGADVTLHADPAAGSAFTGWSSPDAGFDCPDTADCTVTMDIARAVTATFEPAWTLTVQRSGTGSGTVTSDVGAIDCPGTCDDTYLDGTVVTLHAVGDANSAFDSWSGAPAGTCLGSADCPVLIDQARTITAHFDPIIRQLTVTRSGTGTGTVTSLAPNLGIDCGATCAYDFQQGSVVTLHAEPGAGSTFAGWSGGGCSGTSDCNVTIDAAVSVDARFDPAPRGLVVTPAGTGNGSVTSDIGGIDCPGVCGADYPDGTEVTLTAHPGANATFTGWGGDCAGALPTCALTMDAGRSVTATFTLDRHTLTVSTTGTGTGAVTSDVGGIACPGTCSADYDHGTAVVLTPSPSGSSTFAGWNGACSGTGACAVTMDAAQSVTATFNGGGGQTTLGNDDPAVAYNGWAGAMDPAANGGAYRSSDVKKDKATWKSPVTTSVTWVTYTGPDQGKASVIIDGSNKGTIDLYSSVPSVTNKVYAGLASKAHTVVINVLQTKNASSSGYAVRLDAFVVGGTTTQESNPAIKYGTWVSKTNARATDATYRQSASSKAVATVSFTGSSIEWITTRGKGFGKASVTIDGVSMGTVDMYQAATVWRSAITYEGLSGGAHTLVIQILGQKNPAATSNKVIVDGFVVHP